jgi:hypothetical protein
LSALALRSADLRRLRLQRRTTSFGAKRSLVRKLLRGRNRKIPCKIPVGRESAWRRARSALRSQPASARLTENASHSTRKACQQRAFVLRRPVSVLPISRHEDRIQRKSLANIANIPVFWRRRPETGFDQGMRGEVGSDLLVEDGERGVQVLDRPKPFSAAWDTGVGRPTRPPLLRLLCKPPVVSGQNIVHGLKTSSEVGHIGKTPAVCDLTHRSVILQRVFQRLSAAFKPPRPSEAHDRGIFFSKQGVGISDTHSSGLGHSRGVKVRIAQSRFNGYPHVQQRHRSCRRNAWLRCSHGFHERQRN